MSGTPVWLSRLRGCLRRGRRVIPLPDFFDLNVGAPKCIRFMNWAAEAAPAVCNPSCNLFVLLLSRGGRSRWRALLASAHPLCPL